MGWRQCAGLACFFMVALTNNSSAYDIGDVERASYAEPRQTAFTRPQNVFEYSLKVDNICAAGNSLQAVTSDWVGDRPEPWELLTKDRSVAMVAVVTFPGAQGDQIKQVKIPLIAKANFGDVQVENCDGTIITNVPANARMNLHFEFKRSSTRRLIDQSKFIGGVAKVGASVASMAAIGSGAILVGATISPVVTYLEKNVAPLATLTAGANDILSSFAHTDNPNPRQYAISSDVERIRYRNRNTPVFSLTKIVRESGVEFNALNGWLGIGSAYSARYGDISTQFNNAHNAVESPWSNNLAAFCVKLRRYLDTAAKSDRVAVALGVGYHAYYYSNEYGGKSCLNAWEIATLTRYHFAPPFPDAWPTDASPTPVATRRSGPQRASRPSAAAYARLSR